MIKFKMLGFVFALMLGNRLVGFLRRRTFPFYTLNPDVTVTPAFCPITGQANHQGDYK